MRLTRYADPHKMLSMFKRVSSDKKAFSIDIVRALNFSTFEPVTKLASPDDLVFGPLTRTQSAAILRQLPRTDPRRRRVHDH